MPRASLACAAALLLAACGGLGTPDLGTGTISGRLANASAAAYVYPLGRPDLAVAPGAGGEYAIARVPVGTAALVAVDGAPGSWRADLVPVTVAGGGVAQAPDRDATLLPPGGRVAVVARFGGACESGGPAFSIVGTDQTGVTPAAAGSAAILERLPAGRFQLAGRSGGFLDAALDVDVRSGETLALELSLELDVDNASPGCTAPGAGCRPGLVCDPGDGACYECVHDADCVVAPKTLCVNHVCHDPAAAGETCDPCASDVDCEPTTSGSPAVCATAGFCTHACTTAVDCPAGFACVADGARTVCEAPSGCSDAREEFGAECFHDAACADALSGGTCLGADVAAVQPVPGYCTGACSRQDDCDLVPGFACNATSGLCERIVSG